MIVFAMLTKWNYLSIEPFQHQVYRNAGRAVHECSNTWFCYEKTLVANSKIIPSIPLITSQPGRLHSPLCCLSLQGWLSSAWLTARGGVVQSAVCPRPMGESARLLAEASVGKNAERVSHELGACDLSINTAGVWQWEIWLALWSATQHTLVSSWQPADYKS